jgi:hypothetical protein
MERITRDSRKEILSDRTKNRLIAVEFGQISIGLQFRYAKGLSPFPKQPGNGLEFRLGLFPLGEQEADGER